MKIGGERILVVGAGASGMAFALECADQGLRVRVVEKRASRTTVEKATGVALGVWNRLAKYGISPTTVGEAIPMRNFAFYDNGRVVANVPVPTINGNPPAHLYPQGELERHLEEALSIKGVDVEYGVEVLSLEEEDKTISVRIARSRESAVQSCEFEWVIGADGAHSTVRRALDIPFVGRDYPEQWSVAEITTAYWPGEVQAQLYLQSNGVGLFLSQVSKGIVQGILNSSSVGNVLASHFPDAQFRYERQFRVSLRRVPSPRKGRVWLIGDAAHVQSPVGGQGLNLAVWDGITLATSLLNGDLSVERRLAERAQKVLFFTDFDYRMLATKSSAVRLMRNTYWSYAARHPAIANWFFKIISGEW